MPPTTVAPTTVAPTTAAPTTVAPITTAAPTTAAPTTQPPEPIRILVTNDDGVDAPGIDALVNGLLTLENVEVTVVAPATQQSGTGGNITEGALTAAATTTASGYPATAIAGFPADTVIWAVDQGGVDFIPDLVVAGINEGQNLGPVADLSGTIGAARAAAARGIPAIATSQGLAVEGAHPDFAAGAAAVVAFLSEQLPAFVNDDYVEEVVNINVPSCAAGTEIRGVAEVASIVSVPELVVALSTQDCASTTPQPAGDVDAFNVGFTTIATVAIAPAAP